MKLLEWDEFLKILRLNKLCHEFLKILWLDELCHVNMNS